MAKKIMTGNAFHPKLHFTFILFLFFTLSNGQGLDFGLGIGGANYDGDLTPSNKLKIITQTHPAFSGFIRFELNPFLAGTASIMYARISGDDSKSGVNWMEIRNLSFKTNIYEVSGVIEFHPFGYQTFSPFIAAGTGLFSFNPSTEYKGNRVDLRPLGTEGQGLPQYPDRKIYKNYAFAWIIGGGFRYRFNDQMWVSADLFARITTTDYIDDVSKTYVDYNELLNGNGVLSAVLGNRINEGLGISEPENGSAGTKRGSPGIKDYYFVGLFKFHYRIYGIEQSGRKVRKNKKNHWKNCPKF